MKHLIPIWLILLLNCKSAFSQPDLNIPSTFYGHWLGKINHSSFGEGDSIQFYLAESKETNKILYISIPKVKTAKPDTIKCSFEDGVFNLPIVGKSITSNTCNGYFQFSLLDSVNMTASFYTELSNCERLSFRGQRFMYPETYAGTNNVIKDPEQRTVESVFAEDDMYSQNPEPENIAKYGKGKIKRLSDRKLQITLNSGKVIYLNNKGGAEDDNQVSYYFDSLDEKLNSYVFVESGWEWQGSQYVHRVTGKQTSDLDNPYTLSPDKKWLIQFSNDLEAGLEGSFILLFNVSSAGLTEVFNKQTDTYDSPKPWAADGIKWLNNMVVEIDKVTMATDNSIEMKKAGKIWLVNKSGKWSLVNVKPQIL